MSHVHFNTLDLNLLRVFDALHTERSATLAGARLGLSQSAVSHALGRLRQILEDELFVRSAAGLQPTLRATELAAGVGAAMTLLEGAIARPAFDPARSDRQFAIGATAYTCSVLLPGVMRRFVELAPHASLRVRGENLLADELDNGRLDIILGAFDDLPQRFDFTPLFAETGVWVVREDHPALVHGRTIAALAGVQRVVIAPDEVFVSPTGGRTRQGFRRQRWMEITDAERAAGVLTVPDTFSALAMVRQTDMAAILPRRLAERALGGLAIIELGAQVTPIHLGAVVRSGEAGAVAWLVNLLKEAAAAL